MGSIQQLLSSIVSLSSSPTTLLFPVSNDQRKASSLIHVHYDYDKERSRRVTITGRRKKKTAVFVSNKEDTEVSINTAEAVPSDPQVLEYISEIKRVLDLLKRNRDMTFNEVKLTIMIEDPRDVERKRLLGIDDATAPTRDDLATTLEEVNKGIIPEDRVALQLLAEELTQWPNLEVEIERTKGRGKRSLYAKATDTGIDPKEAAKRLNIDWDEAAEITEEDDSDDTDVPPAVGYGALYLVTAFPVIIGVSVVLILFYNSLQ